jgi:hypothetical protein
MTHDAEPRMADHGADDAFLAALREPPRAAFAASLYLKLAAWDAPSAAPRDAGSPADGGDATLPTLESPGPVRHRWRWLAQSAAVAGIMVLVLGVFAVAALALRGQFAPAATAPTSVPVASAELLYAGQLAARSGIIAVRADGSQEHLLAAGDYIGVASSPDGHRFLAYGTTRDANPRAIVDLYDATGQLLRRYELGAVLPLIVYWAPDSRHAALYARTGDAIPGQDDDYQTWLLGEQGARELRLGGQTSVGTPAGTGAWSPQGRLLVGVRAVDSNGDGRLGFGDDDAAWTVAADGGDARRLFDGGGVPIGWSGTGSTVYVVQSKRVLAIDDATGQQRTVATAEEVGRQVRPALAADAARLPLSDFGAIQAAALVAAPAGDSLALWLTPATAVGGTATPAPYLAVIDQQGRVIGQDRAVPGATPTFVAWAPDGSRLAYSVALDDGTGSVRVLDIGAGTAITPAFLAEPNVARWAGTSLRWSPDGRSLAITRDDRVAVARGAALSEVWSSAGTSIGWSNWRPGANP